ncbi:MAG: VanZ family protein [Deltaproteobacteria bacterium]|nr:VanZ family protein [Deltaproteobacteria bacterium]
MEVEIGGQRKSSLFMTGLPLPHFLWVNGEGGFSYTVVSKRMKAMNGTDYFVPKTVFLVEKITLSQSPRFLLGNSPRGKQGWWGEIKGLAVYNRVLPREEILTHSVKVSRKDMSVLAKTPNCLALYPFNEGEGNTVKSISGEPRPFHIPASRNALATTLLSLPHKDMRSNSGYVTDFLNNIIFFVPFGILLTMIILRTYAITYFPTFLIVTLAGGLLSSVIEVLQLFLPTRYPGLADIFSNILGSGLGTLTSFALRKPNR